MGPRAADGNGTWSSVVGDGTAHGGHTRAELVEALNRLRAIGPEPPTKRAGYRRRLRLNAQAATLSVSSLPVNPSMGE
jgi:hypothetical protein